MTTTVAQLADDLLEAWFVNEPVSASLMGIPGHDAELRVPSAESDQELRARFSDIAKRADSVDTVTLTPQDRSTIGFIRHDVRTAIATLDSRSVEYTITDSFIAPVANLLTVLPMVTLTTPEQAADYLTRLAVIPAYVDALVDRHRAGLVDGLLPVAPLVQAAVDHLDRYLASPDADPLASQPAPEPAGTFAADRDRLLAEVVRPAIAGYRDVLVAEVLPGARPASQPGLSWLPGGEQAYANAVRAHTTTDRTPGELHQTGLDIMARLEQEYAEVGGRVFGEADFRATLIRLREDPSLFWNDGAELLTAAREAIRRAERVAPQWFGRLPGQRCVVEAVPASSGAGGPAAYYMPPALDGSRPGTYFANIQDAEKRSRCAAEAVAFHEAVPGHHFQLTISQELTGLPLIRRTGTVTAYAEGWGLYTERLADEMGLYSDDVGLLGMLMMDSMRASRLVLDTGLHALGWSREQAVAYMRDNTPMPQVEIEAEVDRYISWPGQALAYMVGRLEIQRLRADAEQRLGDRFDIRAFHDVVLGSGSLPLPVLAEVVDDWIATG